MFLKKRSNFLTAPPNSSNGTAWISPELISEKAETMIWLFVLQELEKQTAKVAIEQKHGKTSSNKVKSPVKGKPNSTNWEKIIRARSSCVIFCEDNNQQIKKDGSKKKERNVG